MSQTNNCNEIFTSNYSSSSPEYNFPEKRSVSLGILYPTKLCAVKVGIKHIRKDPRMLHLVDPPIDERDYKGSPEQNSFYERIYLPKKLMKSIGKCILKPRYAANPFLIGMMLYCTPKSAPNFVCYAQQEMAWGQGHVGFKMWWVHRGCHHWFSFWIDSGWICLFNISYM